MKVLRLLLNWGTRRRGRDARAADDARASCRRNCPIGMCTLTSCIAGERATVRRLHCTVVEANRLRTLGVYEGALVGIVDRRNGVLLDVCGSRLALDAAVADVILVEPTAA